MPAGPRTPSLRRRVTRALWRQARASCREPRRPRRLSPVRPVPGAASARCGLSPVRPLPGAACSRRGLSPARPLPRAAPARCSRPSEPRDAELHARIPPLPRLSGARFPSDEAAIGFQSYLGAAIGHRRPSLSALSRGGERGCREASRRVPEPAGGSRGSRLGRVGRRDVRSTAVAGPFSRAVSARPLLAARPRSSLCGPHLDSNLAAAPVAGLLGETRKAMPPPGKVPRKENLGLQCEWGSCSFVCSAMEEFCEHVTQHLQQHLHGSREEEEEDDPLGEEFSCLWQECGFCSLDSSADLIRHVYFHCYHTKLKQWGLQALQSQADLSPCVLDFQSRNIIPDIPDHFLCLWEYCESTFDNPEWFYRHVEAHSLCYEYKAVGKDNHVVLCGWKGCSCTFKDRCKLREHLRSHTQEKVVACPTCGGMFANNTKFLDHIRRQTSLDQQRFQCSHCSKRFATERLLRDHMRNHVNHYKCPLCDMTCPLPSSLRNHMRFRHSEDRPFKCDCCDYSCKNLIDLRKHLETHSKEPAYRCDFESCTFSARSLCSVKSHYRKVHEGDSEPRYKCHVCEKCFTRGNSLTVHLRQKHQFKWPSGHPRFRYKEHEDGYMRLQLVRYESVELTQQLLQQPQEGADLVDSALNESSLQDLILETVPGEPGSKDEEEVGRAGEGTVPLAPQDSTSPAMHLVNQTKSQDQQEIVYYMLAEAPGEPPPAPELPSEGVMEKLQDMAKEPEDLTA